MSFEYDAVGRAAENIAANAISISSYIDSSIDELAKAAQKLQDEYMATFRKTSGRFGNPMGSRLPSVRVRVVEGVSTIEIRWYRQFKIDGKLTKKSYTKGSRDSYSVTKITKGAPEWEVELVKITEAEFTKIRKMYSRLAKIRAGLKYLDRVISD